MLDADLQRQKFQTRLQRIKKGAPNTLGQIYVGPADEPGEAAPTKPHFGFRATFLAFVLGGLAYAIGHIGQFHLLTGHADMLAERIGTDAAAVTAAMGDVILAGVALFILIKLCRMRGFGPGLVGAIGLFAMMGAESTAIRAAPEVFAALYSPEFVRQYLQDETPGYSF